MPIMSDENSIDVNFFPKGNPNLFKYFDLLKFVSLIQKRAIFFCRLDKFEDKLEGTLTNSTLRSYEKWCEYLVSSGKIDGLSEDKKSRLIKEQVDAHNRHKSVTCIDCWNKGESESYALWKIYSGIDKGIMIKSNVERVMKAFENTTEKVHLSDVRYIDFNSDAMEIGNFNFPIRYKDKAYSYEEEVRLIHKVNYRGGFTYDWSNEKIESGKNITVDLDLLIEEIVLSPFAPEWFAEIIQDLLEKYGLRKDLKFSYLK